MNNIVYLYAFLENIKINEEKQKALKCLDFVITQIQKEYRNIKINSVIKRKILNDYMFKCADFRINYVRGHLDTFEKAACLMSAIQKNVVIFYGNNQINDVFNIFLNNISSEDLNFKGGKELKAKLSVDAALKMCENPVYYKSERNDEPPIIMDKLNLEKFKEKYRDEWNSIYHELLCASIYSKGNSSETLSKYLMLKYLYNYVNSKLKDSESHILIKTYNNKNNN